MTSFVTEGKPAPGRPVVTSTAVSAAAQQGRVPLVVLAVIHSAKNGQKLK
jgi:hypothetical protein